MMAGLETDKLQERPKPAVPPGVTRLLLHTCCAPCSGEIIEAIKAGGLPFTVFYYNPNIDPRDEYERRKADNKRFAEKLGVPFVDADYDPDVWRARIKGLENEPERGARCTACFSLRLERAAFYAHEKGYNTFATSLGISRWKNLEQVNACGRQAAARYDDVTFWDYNWRKNGGSERRFLISRREGFYEQKYCGCVYSRHKVNAPAQKESART